MGTRECIYLNCPFSISGISGLNPCFRYIVFRYIYLMVVFISNVLYWEQLQLRFVFGITCNNITFVFIVFKQYRSKQSYIFSTSKGRWYFALPLTWITVARSTCNTTVSIFFDIISSTTFLVYSATQPSLVSLKNRLFTDLSIDGTEPYNFIY